jgi:hypothetical protein
LIPSSGSQTHTPISLSLSLTLTAVCLVCRHLSHSTRCISPLGSCTSPLIMQCQHSEGRATPSAKLSSRPRIAVKAPVTPSSTRSPPLTTSQFDNTPHVSSLLTPREGGVKLRIKSSTTPEAKSRLAIRKPPAGVPPVPPILSTPSYRASAHSAPRHAPDTQVPSGSTLDTSDAWLGGQSSGDAYETVQADSQGQKLEASEAVLVTVR